MSQWYNGTADYLNDTTPSGGTIPNPTSNDEFYVGDARVAPSTASHVVEAVVYNAALTDTQIAGVNEYLLAVDQAPPVVGPVQTIAGQTTGLLDLSGRDTTGLGPGQSSVNTVGPKLFSAGSDLGLNDIPWSDGSLSGTFDLSFVATGSQGNVRRGGKGAWGTGGNALLSAAGESVTLGELVASDFTGDLLGVTNLQYNAVYLGNGGASESALLNGVSAGSAPGGDTTAAMRNDIALASTVLALQEAGSVSIGNIDITFDAEVVGDVPEPATMALLGLAICGLGRYVRRRPFVVCP